MPIKNDKLYRQHDPTLWRGRNDGRFHESIKPFNIQYPTKKADGSAIGILGFSCDEGVRRNNGRPGAAEGPDAFRRAFAGLPVHTSLSLYDCGSIYCLEGDLEGAQEALAEAVAIMHNHEITPFVIGGGHEVAYGHFLGIAQAGKGDDLAIVNIDAHYDLREEERSTSGTSFSQIASYCRKEGWPFDYTCIGIQQMNNSQSLSTRAATHDAKVIFSDQLHQGKIDEAMTLLETIIRKRDALYLTICLDVFAEPFAPGVSAPQPLGLLPWQLIPILRQAAQSGKIIGLDIAELSPPFDRDEATAKLAASLASEIFHYLRV